MVERRKKEHIPMNSGQNSARFGDGGSRGFNAEDGSKNSLKDKIFRNISSSDPTIGIHIDSEDRTAAVDFHPSHHREKQQLDFGGPVAEVEVFMTPMVGEDTSLSASAGVRSYESSFTRNVNSSENSSYMTPSKTSINDYRSLFIQDTPEGLKPRPNFRSLQSRVETTMSSDDFSVAGRSRSSNQSSTSSISRWSKAPSRQSYSIRSNNNILRGEILPMHPDKSRNPNRYSQNLYNAWELHQSNGSRLSPAPLETHSFSSEHASNGIETPNIDNASSARTAIGATVAKSVNLDDVRSHYSRGSKNSNSFRSQRSSNYSFNSMGSPSSSHWRGSSRYSRSSRSGSFIRENESSDNMIRPLLNVDFDVDYEPLTEVGKVVKEMSTKKTFP